MNFDPKYDPEHYNWDSTQFQTAELDPLYEHLRYYTPFGQRWMSNLEDILKEEPTLRNMNGMINSIKQYLEQETENMKWWNDMADRYYKRDELERQKKQAKPYEKAKLSFEVNRMNREIKKVSNGFPEKIFHEKYDQMVEKHQEILMFTEDLRARLSIGIDLFKHAAVREIYEKYPDLRGTKAGKEIASYFKEVNAEVGRDLRREEIEHRYETRPNPEIKKLRDAFLAADQEKLVMKKELTEHSLTESETQNLTQNLKQDKGGQKR